MASILAFNNLTAANPSATVTTAQFANGTGIIVETGNDVKVTTGDFRIHHVRKAINRRGRFSVFGNLTESLRSTGGLGGAIVLKLGSSTIATFTGILIPTYNEETMRTDVEIRGDAAVS